MSYWKFAAMIVTSTVVMFILMYLNTYLTTHLFWSETRAYMAVLMGATMAFIMLAYMLSMYSNKALNIAIFAGSIVVFAGSLWLVRSQTTVGDTSYMRAMIPHHSIAIMTSSRANIEDARVRKLADEIIFAQDKEIAEMRYLVDDIDARGVQSELDEKPNEPKEIVSLEEALSTANVAILDPGFLKEAEIAKALPDGPVCSFSYTSDSDPVFVTGVAPEGTAGIVKLSGDLVGVDMTDTPDLARGFETTSDGMTIKIQSPSGDALNASGATQEADMILELDAGLSAGYRGFYRCAA